MTKKVLFAGLGSIGRRNLAACQRVRPDYQYAAWRSGESPAPAPAGVSELRNEAAARAFAADIVWICTPTALHAATLAALGGSARAFFVEKPLASTAADVAAIEKALQGKIFHYGCVFRHHPLVTRMRELIASRTLGRPLSYRLRCGSDLSAWRPGRDYRETYSARRALGGGVSLDLIHEFDYAEFWFGPARALTGIKRKLSDLEIDTEDYCAATLTHESGVSGQVTLDYFRKPAARDFEVTFTGGVASGDLLTGRLSFADRSETHAIERDALHDLQARSVFDTLESGGAGPWSLREAAHLNRAVLAIPEEVKP